MFNKQIKVFTYKLFYYFEFSTILKLYYRRLKFYFNYITFYQRKKLKIIICLTYLKFNLTENYSNDKVFFILNVIQLKFTICYFLLLFKKKVKEFFFIH